MFRVLALDPGGTTGWASYSLDDDPATQGVFDCGQIGPEEHHLELYNFLGSQQARDFTIVCERFEYRNTSRAGLVLDSKEYIGVTRLFSQERNVPVVFQNASQAKGFVKDIHIKRFGLWHHGWKHAMDGYRHLLFYLATNSDVPEDLRKAVLRKGWQR